VPPDWLVFVTPPGAVAAGVVCVGVDVGIVGVLAVPGVVAPPVAVVVAGGKVAAPGTVAVGVVVAAGVVTVLVDGVGAGPESPASLTSAAASTPRASATVTAIVAAGAFQFGVAARRVRAAAPHCRHHS